MNTENVLDNNTCNLIIKTCKESGCGKELCDATLLLDGFRPFFSPWRYSTGADQSDERAIWNAYVKTPNMATKWTAYRCEDLPVLRQILPARLCGRFNMIPQSCKITVYEMKPGNFTLPHYDVYRQLKNRQKAVRIWVSLSPAAFGHILWIDGEEPYTMLPQGTVIQISKDDRIQDKLHTGANLGYEDRWFMTVTGEQLVS
jgi:hypothetical protein